MSHPYNAATLQRLWYPQVCRSLRRYVARLDPVYCDMRRWHTISHVQMERHVPKTALKTRLRYNFMCHSHSNAATDSRAYLSAFNSTNATAESISDAKTFVVSFAHANKDANSTANAATTSELQAVRLGCVVALQFCLWRWRAVACTPCRRTSAAWRSRVPSNARSQGFARMWHGCL